MAGWGAPHPLSFLCCCITSYPVLVASSSWCSGCRQGSAGNPSHLGPQPASVTGMLGPSHIWRSHQAVLGEGSRSDRIQENWVPKSGERLKERRARAEGCGRGPPSPHPPVPPPATHLLPWHTSLHGPRCQQSPLPPGVSRPGSLDPWSPGRALPWQRHPEGAMAIGRK